MAFIAFRAIAGEPQKRRLFTANLDGSNLTLVPTGRSVPIDSPSWTPDGQGFLYENFVNADAGLVTSIRAVRRNGQSERQIVPRPAGSVAVSPDGRRIVYSDNVLSRVENTGVSVANSDGTGSVRLADGRTPAWSRDGRRITYVAAGQNGQFDVYVMNADGSGQTRLTDTPEKELDPDFSPDGNRIAYTSTPSGVEAIFTMNSDGSNQRRLTNGLSESRPEWTRDGRRIAYISRNNTSVGIYVMNSDGSGQKPLTNPLIETDNFDLR